MEFNTVCRKCHSHVSWGFVHINVLPSTQAKKELLNDTFFVDIYDPVSLEAWDYPQELFKWSVVFALNIL